MFAALRPAARSSSLSIKILGSCVPGSAAAAPATPDALRLHAVRDDGAPPLLVVACAEDAAGEEALLVAAQAHLDSWAARHMIVHACRGGGASRARWLLGSDEGGSSAANRTKGYTYCDPTCQKHVSPWQGMSLMTLLRWWSR